MIENQVEFMVSVLQQGIEISIAKAENIQYIVVSFKTISNKALKSWRFYFYHLIRLMLSTFNNDGHRNDELTKG